MYVDPGYGTLIVQGAFAAMLGVFLVARQKATRFLRRFTGSSRVAPRAGAQSSAEV